MHIMYLRPNPLQGGIAGINSRQPGGIGSLDRGQGCLSEARPQALPVRRRIPHGNRPQTVHSS